ncbi:YXWGXW repeat-containing protein [Gluconacetobacter takamatsuzukensis]|uniref:BcpO-related WXXGXW repeat protein n=1 Tax=Gluconacetobacter takamatsuzukensis TaxID=1286190 RepID=A0A7W4PRY5_9PROT|nr:YXWGXW repeat-containing protein [Gluconacetobacter takamatsuzukensis]MBB2204386.1 BcpO-related WXXGXW repeat protein [Gluconacetobacter takamatsuzukensis]
MNRQIVRGALLALGVVAGGAMAVGDAAPAQAQAYRYGPVTPGWAPPPMPPPRAEIVPPPRPGWVWVGGGWDWTNGGYAWVPGRYVRGGRRGGWGPGRWMQRGPRWVWVRPGWR